MVTRRGPPDTACWGTAGGQRGQALIESILLGLVFLVPVIWMLGMLAQVHRAALASTAAVREAGFDAARAQDRPGAARAIEQAVAASFADHQLDPDRVRLRWSAPRGFQRGGTVEVEVSYPVSVVQMPLFGSGPGPSINIVARHVARIDPFRSER
jgi:hypothetical protein